MLELTQIYDHGVFLRRDALQYGYLDRDLRRAVAEKVLVRVRHGAYAAASRWRELDSAERHALACHAVLLSHDASGALSHVSGAVFHGMSTWGSDLSRVHLTRLGASASRRHHDVAYHDAPAAREVMEAHGAKVLLPSYCALGAAAMNSVEAGVVLIDSAYQLGLCTEGDVRSAYEDMAGWAGTARLRITLSLAQAGAESVGESRARFLFWKQHIPRPVLQYPVYDGGVLVGRSDFAWPEYKLLGEFDGKVKYGRLLVPGDDPSSVVFREKVREDRMRELTGWGFVRFTWPDLEQPDRTGVRLRGLMKRR